MDAGNLVKANGDAPLAVINRIRPTYVRFARARAAVAGDPRAAADGPLAVRASAPDEPGEGHAGTLAFVDNAVDEGTGTILLKAEFPNADDALWPGEFVDVTLVLGALDDVVTVPAQAVDTGQDGDFLFVVGDDATVSVRPVTVSHRIGNVAVIADGLAAGERVVTDGQLRLRPGAKIVEKRGGRRERGERLMNLSALFIRRPIMTTLVTLAILIFGLAGYRQLPVSDLPNVDFPTLNVTASLPGASPETMASAVATPLEKQFSTIAGIDSMTSSSSLGRAPRSRSSST